MWNLFMSTFIRKEGAKYSNTRRMLVFLVYFLLLPSFVLIFSFLSKNVHGQIIDNCNQNQFSMVFVLVAKEDAELTQERISKLTTIKDLYVDYFSVATRNLASVDTSYPVVTMVDEGDLLNYEGDRVVVRNVAKKFYSTYSDSFDFINIYTTFETPAYQYHMLIYNQIQGIGLIPRNYRSSYGGSSRLLGISHLKSIDNYSEDLYTSYNALLHENGHQWCCYVGNNFARGTDGAQLEIIQQGIHFYRGLDSPNDHTTSMGSDHWVNNGDDTFHRESFPGVFKYHDFQLYFMGLQTPSEYTKEFRLYDAGVPPDYNFTNATFYKTVSVNDIIVIEGSRRCLTITPTYVSTSPEPTPILLVGDANNDGYVNEKDYVIWINYYKQTVRGGFTQGDFNNDSVVNGVDYILWYINYGRSLPTLSAQQDLIR
jgi:hypothetical protein